MFSFRLMTETDLPQVLTWRTSEHVTRFMLSDIQVDLEAQRHWFQRISDDPGCCYWLIIWQDKPVGVIHLSDLNVELKEASWGFYIGDTEVMNLGGLLPPYFYNFVFQQLRLTRLKADVVALNELVLKLHKLHGYQVSGTHTHEKNNEIIEVIEMQLSQKNWLARKKFHRYQASFPLKSGMQK